METGIVSVTSLQREFFGLKKVILGKILEAMIDGYGW